MTLYHIILLAVIQGLTEFLPVSSSGHLVLVHAFTEDSGLKGIWNEQNLVMDVAVHIGTLLAVLLYFRKDVFSMIFGLKDLATGNLQTKGAKLGLFVVGGSIPVIIAGLILSILEPDWLRSLYVMATATIFFGIILWWADAKGPETRSLEDMKWKDVLWIGLAQILALIPGTSRSGITMTAGRFLGFSRTESAHYSLLLAMVAISGAGALTSLDLIKSEDALLTQDALIGIALSFITSLASIAVMMKFLEKCTFKVFAIYRVALGIALFGIIYSGVLA
ncbi:MAG: undecaprenyl-diphosphate phosphatase [Alphaproteobacteria bacterium]|nr:undecaprenyl-diphosphate phosphatase [Alphaproteobacteria bacterium]